jgi:hypothetical protein
VDGTEEAAVGLMVDLLLAEALVQVHVSKESESVDALSSCDNGLYKCPQSYFKITIYIHRRDIHINASAQKPRCNFFFLAFLFLFK